MRLSLVVPTFNSLPFIKNLVEGILSASVAPDEIIFVDAYSTDGTFEYISAARFPCPVSIHQRPPKGVYDAWNFGIENTLSEWVMVACADDLVYPRLFQCIRSAEARLKERDGFIAWTIDIIDEMGDLLDTVPDPAPSVFLGRLPEAAVCRLAADVEALLVYLLRGYRVSFMALAFRREVWSERPFQTDLGASADIEWLLEAHLRKWGTLQLPDTLAAWRSRGESVTGTSSRVSRLNAHRGLQQRTFERLASTLRLDPRARQKLEQLQPAVDVYDYISAARQAPNLFQLCAMLSRAVSAAGVPDFLRLALRRAGVLRSWRYRKPLEQARLVAGEDFFAETIRAVAAAATPSRDLKVST